MVETHIKLRGHHLLCLLTYIGRGYTPAFVANYDAVVARLNAGAPIELAEGPDDICAALQCSNNGNYQDAGHCLKASAAQRDIKALNDIGAALGMPLRTGTKITFTETMARELRKLFTAGTTRSACEGCEWHGLCTSIAADEYKGAKLLPTGGVGNGNELE